MKRRARPSSAPPLRAVALALACAVASTGGAAAQEALGSDQGGGQGSAGASSPAASDTGTRTDDTTGQRPADSTRDDAATTFEPFAPRDAADTLFGGSPVGRLGAGLPPGRAGLFSGSPAQPGGLGAPLGPPAGYGLPDGRAYTVRPSVVVQELWTDNLYQDPRNKRSDFITTITPNFYVAADTARLRGGLTYAPTYEYYANTPGQDRLDHRFVGDALATIVPESLFLALSGSGDTRTATGGYTPEGTTVVGRNNRVQTVNLSATPYYVHRFGGWATAIAGYSYSYGSTSGSDAFLPGSGQRYFTSQDYTSSQIFGVLRSGENLGRVALEGRISGTTFSGSGVLNGAHRDQASVQALYGITRNIAAFVEGGYEDQSYAGTPRVSIQGPIWSVGTRLRPNEYSVITARYGRRDGYNSASLEANVALGPRTQLLASYNDRLTTSTQRGTDLLSTGTLDESGYPGSLGNNFSPATDTGSFGSNPFLATQGGLLRVKRAALSISRSFTRDTVSLALFREEQTPIATTSETVAFSQRGTSGSISWAHELTPEMTAIGYFQYGTYTSPTFGSGNTATASASLVRRFTPRLSGNLLYAISRRDNGTDRFAGINQGTSIQNLVLVSLRQDF
ncbi:TIGR03016 family PEP-CTERM system-associated outer membrane protein [Muricoccus aerilatus]|uniref:TIGR03016 family PEP-CTERM system-associated outer membrane protein n=1 Tax=Muricoccus aerilatus TaxID=452982 RepID=UPI0012EB57EE|nr:TIGR03016 family PEP-CTERM system-associated outer membrane protein [Roseomonas aerilata]